MITNEINEINEKLTITELAHRVGVTPKTIMRWEKAGKIKKPKRDWKGWRCYSEEDLQDLHRITHTVYSND